MTPETENYSVWASASVRALARERWPGPELTSLEEIPDDCPGLIVVGGGRMMDEAKYLRARRCPAMGLVLVPSLWGSGAECSPIVALNRGWKKHIEVDREFLPDQVIYWPELLRTVPADRARSACGDVWSHALEAFLSPLGEEDVPRELASLIRWMLQLPLETDARWFEASARACELQAKSSVGLVHGIAHVLEARMIAAYPAEGWGHAKLCSVFLLPVMELNRRNSAKWAERAVQYDVNASAVEAVLAALHDPGSYDKALPLLRENWGSILGDPCTRTNGTLVRPQAIDLFEEWSGQ